MDQHLIAHRVRRAYPVHRNRVWIWSLNPIRWRVFLGSDEYFKHTLVLGPLVIAGESCCGCACSEPEIPEGERHD